LITQWLPNATREPFLFLAATGTILGQEPFLKSCIKLLGWTSALSPQLVERLEPVVQGRSADEPLFLSGEGKRLEPDNLVNSA